MKSQSRIKAIILTDDVDRVIGRAIVNDDRLPIRRRLADQRIKRARQVSCAVVGADDDAEEGPHCKSYQK